MQESGCRLEHSSATRFRNHVMEGEWDKVGPGSPGLHNSMHCDRQGIGDPSSDRLSVLYCKMKSLFGQETSRYISLQIVSYDLLTKANDSCYEMWKEA